MRLSRPDGFMTGRRQGAGNSPEDSKGHDSHKRCGFENMSRHTSSCSQRMLAGLKILAASSFLALGGCSFTDEVLWPAVAGDDPATTSYSASPASSSATPSNTQVGAKVDQLRGELTGLQAQLQTQAAELENLRVQTSAHAQAYHTTKGGIEARLQVGTTPGNPELVQSWNQAQAQLDEIARDINSMSALSTSIASNAASANYLLDTAQATFGLSGAVDQDHRALEQLQVDTNQTIVQINRLLNELRQDTARQTTYLANERANLTTLSNAIKRGQLFGRPLGGSMSSAVPAAEPAARSTNVAAGTPPLVVIRFDRPNVDYERALYTALSQALERRPDAEFTVMAVSPSQGTAANVQLAQSESRKNAQKVFQSMSDMGLPTDRVQLSATTSGDVSDNEVRIFVR